MMKNASLQRHAKARKSLRLLDQPFLLNTSDHGQATARRLLPHSEPGSGFAALWFLVAGRQGV